MAVDSQQFGELRSDVRHLADSVDSLTRKVDELVAAREQSKGAIWAGRMIAGMVGGIVSILGSKWFH